MKRLGKQGFSMIELLVVLLIIGILAAVAAPLFLANSTKAKISEAVAGAGAIRSGERTFNSSNGGGYQVVTASETIYFGSTAAATSSSLLGVTIHGNKYFSPNAYTVNTVANGAAWPANVVAGAGLTANPVDFVILVNGANSQALTFEPIDGAANAGDVSAAGSVYEVVMDNAGQTAYSINGGTSWSKF